MSLAPFLKFHGCLRGGPSRRPAPADSFSLPKHATCAGFRDWYVARGVRRDSSLFSVSSTDRPGHVTTRLANKWQNVRPHSPEATSVQVILFLKMFLLPSGTVFILYSSLIRVSSLPKTFSTFASLGISQNAVSWLLFQKLPLSRV